MKIYEVAIIGGGASGLMFAAHLKNKRDSIIIESTNKLGNKILISGGGRCNFANKEISCKDYLGDCDFFNRVYKKFNNRWLIRYFETKGLEYSVKNQNEYFCKNSAKELLDILLNDIKPINVSLNSKVVDISKENELFKIKSQNRDFLAKKVVIASGGLSFAKIGASSIGFDIAKKFKHTITPLMPALVGFTLQKEQAFFKELSGVSTNCTIKVADKEFKSKILFAHKGISGPAVLNASLFWSKGKISIDFLNEFNLNSITSSKKELVTILPMPKRLNKLLLEHIGLNNKNANRLTQNEIKKLLTLKNYTFAPAGTFGYTKAEVTKGGIDTKEIDSTSLMSKRVKNLFFLGEVLDITGRLGGYNLQWAFSSGAYCAKYINRKLIDI